MGIPLVALQSNAPEIAKETGNVVQRQLSLRKLLDEQKISQQTQQMNQIQIQEAQRQQAEAATVNRAYNDAAGDPDKFQRLLPAYGVSYDTQQKIKDHFQSDKEKQLKMTDDEHKQYLESNKIKGEAIDSIGRLPPEAQSAAWTPMMQQLAAAKVLSPQEQQQFSQYPGPDGVKQLALHMKTQDQLDARAKADREAAAETRAQEKQDAEKVRGTLGGALAAPTAELQLYQQAKKEGYQGTLEQWLAKRANEKDTAESTGQFTQAVTNERGQTVGWVNPKSGQFRPVGAVKGLPEALGSPTSPATGAAVIPAKPSVAITRMAQTAQMTLPLIDDSLNMLNDVQKELGPGAGRWNDLWTGKVGLKNTDFAAFKAQMTFVESAVTLAHSQGRVSNLIYQQFQNLYGKSSQDPANLKAALTIGKKILTDYANYGQTPIPAAGKPPSATMKVPGSDGKLHWSDGKADLGVAE